MNNGGCFGSRQLHWIFVDFPEKGCYDNDI